MGCGLRGQSGGEHEVRNHLSSDSSGDDGGPHGRRKTSLRGQLPQLEVTPRWSQSQAKRSGLTADLIANQVSADATGLDPQVREGEAATSTSVWGSLTHTPSAQGAPLGAQPPCREPKMRAAVTADTQEQAAGSQTPPASPSNLSEPPRDAQPGELSVGASLHLFR